MRSARVTTSLARSSVPTATLACSPFQFDLPFTKKATKTQKRRRKSALTEVSASNRGPTDKIAELDSFLREAEPDARGTIREAHPEVCFWALNDESATEYSKTAQPAAAFWERIGILEAIDSTVVDDIRDASTDLDAKVGSDDVIDAFALALTASPKTGSLRTLPDEPPTDDTGKLPMEMVYAYP